MTINEYFEETEKQHWVASADYGIQEITLSREDYNDAISLKKKITWPDLENEYPPEGIHKGSIRRHHRNGFCFHLHRNKPRRRILSLANPILVGLDLLLVI